MLGQFKIVVPTFNSVNYLPQTLHSIEIQEFDHPFEVCIVDDASSLPKQREIILEFCQRHRWKSIFQAVNQGPLTSLIHGIRHLNCQDEDVIVVVDGDDWLAHSHVLKTLEKAYASSSVYLTYGSFETYPPHCLNLTYAAPINSETIEKQLYRHMPWIFQPLRTFKYHLWKRIKDEDLRDEDNQYYKVTGDRAFFYPLLEMAGRHIHFIDEIVYVYNLENPLNDHKTNREEQLRVEFRLKAQKKYSPLG